jgi:hypothetical protein
MTSLFPVRFFALSLLIASAAVMPLSTEAQEQPLPNSHIPLCMEDCVHDCMGHDNPTDRGNCLEREKCHQQPACPSKGGGASFSIDRGPTKGEIQIKCADSDSTRQCVDAVGPVISTGGGTTSVVYATTSIKCGTTIVTISTGTNGGRCYTSGSPGQGNYGASCNDEKEEQVASANCNDLCKDTKNSGSCTMK